MLVAGLPIFTSVGFPDLGKILVRLKRNGKNRKERKKIRNVGLFFRFHAILPWDLPALFAGPAARRPTADHDTNY